MSFESILTFPFYLSGPAQGKFKLVPLEMFAESPPTTLNTDNDMEKLHETPIEAEASLRRNVSRESILNHDIFSSGELYLRSKQHRNIIAIIGSAGSGKTCLLKMMLSQSCIQTLYDFVFFIQCQYIDFSVETNLLHVLAGTLPYQWICDEDVCAGVLKTVADSKKVLILIDGYDGGLSQSDSVFDPVTSETNTAFAKSFIESILSQTILSKAKIVVSARSSSFFDLKEPLRSYPAIEISGLNSAAQEEVCKNVCLSTASKVFEFIKFYPSLLAWCVIPETCTAVVHVTDKFLQQQKKEVVDPSDLLLLRVAIASWALLLKSKYVSLEHHDLKKLAFAAWNQVTEGKMNFKDADLPVGRCFNGVSALVKVDIVREKHHTTYVRSFYHLWAEILAALYFVFYMDFEDFQNILEKVFLNVDHSSYCSVVYHIYGLSDKVSQSYMKKILPPFHFPIKKLEFLENRLKNETEKLKQYDKALPFLSCLAKAKLDDKLAGYIGSLLDESMLTENQKPIYKVGLLHAKQCHKNKSVRLEIEALQQVYSQCRLLFVCRSCFNLKPPVLEELCKTSLTCPWCSNIADYGELLLFEQRREKDVEYVVIRKCMLQSDALKTHDLFFYLPSYFGQEVIFFGLRATATSLYCSKKESLQILLFVECKQESCDYHIFLSLTRTTENRTRSASPRGRRVLFVAGFLLRYASSFTIFASQSWLKHCRILAPDARKRMNLMCKSCSNMETCKHPHSCIELRIWILETQYELSRTDLIELFQFSVKQECKPLKGELHCIVCLKNFPTGEEFGRHRDSFLHQKLTKLYEPNTFQYRPVPSTEKVTMCQSSRKGVCENGDLCLQAHSAAELKEWKRRLQWQKNKSKYSDANQMSFVNSILHELKSSSSSALVLKDKLPGIKFRIRKSTSQRLVFAPNKPATCKWRLTIHCHDHTEKLNHAAFHTTTEGARNAFRICCFRKGKYFPTSGHLNFKVSRKNNNSPNLFNGDGTFEVNFEAKEYGYFSSYLFLEFQNSPRPVLMIEFDVEVLDSSTKYSTKSDPNRAVYRKVPSWERQREIVRWRNFDDEGSFSTGLKKIRDQYKPPSAAFEYTKTKPLTKLSKLNSSNYGKSMHHLLYKEEDFRNQRVLKSRFFGETVLTTNYFLEKKHMDCSKSQLFAVFQMPDTLSRDVDEELLILENCTKVLIGRQKDPSNSPVYEALIEEKFVDHIVILLSENCVKSWQLKSGETVEVEIQFQLDRDRFCRCHYALDQLKANKVALICPTSKSSMLPVQPSNVGKEIFNLDDDQMKVLSFLKSDYSAAETIPLFVVQGSFGTGKTYTISKCIQYLLEHDKNAKILVCTHSNSAADLYISNNFEDLKKWKSKVLRIVYHQRKTSTVPSLVQQYCLLENGKFFYPTPQQIASNQVFITTFETSLFLGSLGTPLEGCFTHIFLDEVAQVMEPVAIIPITLAISEKSKIVIAGDHKQMTEKIYCRESESDLDFQDADFTLLSRLYKTYRCNQLNNFTVLRNNYRCVSPILKLIEQLFYAKNLLRPHSSTKPLLGFVPVQFHDVEGHCELNRLTGGYFNEVEAAYIKDLVKDLLVNYQKDLKQEDVVVLASYRAQVNIIREKLRLNKCVDVKVHTIRDIQGLEYKIVILSCVHKREAHQDTDGENYGFLSDRNMLNTAFTRSKLGIIAVGHAVTLWTLGKCAAVWQKYIKFCCEEMSMFPREKIENIEKASKELMALSCDELFRRKKSTSLPINEDQTAHQKDTLPQQDDILDDIMENNTGIKPEKLVIKVDRDGVEFVSDKMAENENDPNFDSTSNDYHCDYSVDQLRTLVAQSPKDTKICTLCINTPYSATALLHEPDEDLDKIQITTKRNMGRSFDQDEVVVKIENTVLDEKSNKKTAYGKVIGIMSRYKDLREKKFMCLPDDNYPALMCPIDNKTTKFFIEDMRKKGLNDDWKFENLNVPIHSVKKNKDGKETTKTLRYVTYDRFAMELDKKKHFVVRFIEWSKNSSYPVGYVSEEIKPKDYEKYYSLLHDVPESKYKNSVNEEAKMLAEKKLDDTKRKNLEHLFVFTIDPKGSTILDDAMSVNKCKEHQDCWKIGIHIADVASVIPADSDVDWEASTRRTSFYGGVSEAPKKKKYKASHMLPPILSSNKCSLRSDGQKRPTVSVFIHSAKLPVITLAHKTEELNTPTPQLTLVKSRRQLTYADAERDLRSVRKNGFQGFEEPNEKNIRDQLYIIWKTMLKLRFRRISWSSFYGEPEFNKFDQFCNEYSAHMLIEEAMITCNACCSQFLQKKGCNFVLKTQGAPLPDESAKWKEENMKAISLSLHLQERVKQMHGENELQSIGKAVELPKAVPIFYHVWIEIEEALERNDLETALILFSSDKLQPFLSPGNTSFLNIQKNGQLKLNSRLGIAKVPNFVTHFSMRLPLYSQFTSPIRRYDDLRLQRMILDELSPDKKSKTPGVLEITKTAPSKLKEISHKVKKKCEDARKFEKDVKLFSFALNLSRDQNYEVANIEAVDESGILLNYPDFIEMPSDAIRLYFSDMKLREQTKESISWRIRYFEVDSKEMAEAEEVFHNLHTSTMVSSEHWHNLVSSAKSLAFDCENPISIPTRETLKANFVGVLKSREGMQVCKRTSKKRTGPCDNENCRKEKNCRDYLDGMSKLNMFHYRVITMPLDLGTTVLVQLHCGVNRGICVPSVELLSVAQDLDICAAHNRHPVETFAADVRPVAGKKFDDIENYVSFWRPLLVMESVYTSVKDATSSTIFQNVAITFSVTDGRLGGEFSLSALFCEQRAIRPSRDDFVCIRVKYFDRKVKKGDLFKMSSHKSSYTWVLHGKITSSVQRDNKVSEEENEETQSFSDGSTETVLCTFVSCVLLVPKPKIPPGILRRGQSVKATVELIQLGMSNRGLVDSLIEAAAMCKEDRSIIPSLCLQKQKETILRALSEEPSANAGLVIHSVGQSVAPGMRFRLNEGQVKEIRRALRSQIALIQGPPGTGKSFVGAHLAYYFHHINHKEHKPKKILYCGPSNRSVDVVAEYLLDSRLKVLRIYGSTFEEEDFSNPLKPGKTGQKTEKRPNLKLRSITLHHVIRQGYYAKTIRDFDKKFAEKKRISLKEYRSYKSIQGQAKLAAIRESHVIVCTCAVASIFRDSVDSQSEFSQCIIDECGMCSEPETLAPIVASKAKQVVLIGDHKQLQPVIQCLRAREFGLQKSLFERKADESGMLKHQYRMDPGICDFPSKHFYGGALTTDQSVLDREAKRSFRFGHPAGSKNTAVFCHVIGTEQINHSSKRGGESSYYNETEARVVLQILLYLRRNNVSLSDIMILSPYRAQVTTIKELIVKERSQFKHVHVGTVVTSQGSESDFVILSTVRSRPSSAIEDQANVQWRRKFIGFVSDPHQINVAITRAKSGLCIVGNKNLLKKDTETWAKLLEHYEERESIVDFENPTAPWNLNS